MAYLGNDLQVAYQSYQIIDDISSSFNGVLTTFPLQVGGVTPVPFPINPQQCLISVNGVIQEPDPSGTSGFNLVGSNIVFSSAPTGGHAFFGVILAGADYVNVGVNYPSGSESAPSITFDTDLDTGIYNPAANELGFSTNSVQRLKIESNGDINIDSGGAFYNATNNRLGIGTTSPGALLDLGTSTPILRFSDTDTTGYHQIQSSNANFIINSDPSNADNNSAISFNVDGSERARIDSSGNVGIGTSSPSTLLHLQSSTNNILFLESSDSIADIIGADTTGSTRIRSVGGELSLWTGGDASSDNAVSANQNVTIDRSGRLLVGTSSWSGNNSKLVCAGNTGNASGVGLITAARGDVSANLSLDSEVGRYVFTDLNGGEFARIACLVDRTPGATNDYPGRLVFSTTADGASSPTERWRINRNGTLVSSGGNIDNQATYLATTANSANMYVGAGGIYQRSTSSIKYKTDIETLQDKYADAVLECRPVWYRSTCESDCAEYSWWGFIAEEVAEIDPRLVHWKTTESTIQEDGRLVKTPCNPEPDGVAYDRFVPHLLNLIKRQKEQIEAMEARLSALEAS